MKRVEVTIEVETDDVRDVLDWFKFRTITNATTERWLVAYSNTEGAQRDAIFRAMPPSLQWCVHEFEKHGSDALDSVLRTAAEQASQDVHP